MSWTRKEYDWDGGVRHCWVFAFPFGEMCVDFADWIDAEAPWITYWYPTGTSEGVEITDKHGNNLRCDSDKRGMLVAEEWLRWKITGTANALMQGRNEPQDDGC